MLRREIIEEIKNICIERYEKIDDWNHDINHVKRVVSLVKKIGEKEKLSSKELFLVELAAWLHDIGRVGEDKGLDFEKSNHAEKSYRQSRNILKKYGKYIGREGVCTILEAVREHSKGILVHKNNKISKVLQDADRGASINMIGVFSILDYRKIIEDFGSIHTFKEAREKQKILLKKIKLSKKENKAFRMINNLRVFYYGEKLKDGNYKVLPLHTNSAKKMFEKGIKEIEEFMELIKK